MNQKVKKPARVLLIEDNEFLSRMYKKLLAYSGYQVGVAQNAKIGLEEAINFHPNIIFLDVMLPDMNGLEVLKILKKNRETSNIPTILLTNLGLHEELEKALKIGALKYMIKNEFDPHEIVKVVQEVIDEK